MSSLNVYLAAFEKLHMVKKGNEAVILHNHCLKLNGCAVEWLIFTIDQNGNDLNLYAKCEAHVWAMIRSFWANIPVIQMLRLHEHRKINETLH